MKICLVTPALLLLVLFIGACGESGDQSAEIAASLPKNATNEGDKLTGVSCAKRSETVYRCVGEYKTSDANAILSYAESNGITEADTAQMDETLRRAIVEQASGPVSYDVTVKDDGYIFELAP